MKTFETFNLDNFKQKFKEGIYSDGFKIIEAWWSYEKEQICLVDVDQSIHLQGHSSCYPIIFFTLTYNYKYIGKV